MRNRRNLLTKGGVLLLGDDAGWPQGIWAALRQANYEVLPTADLQEAQARLEIGGIDILVVNPDPLWEGIGPWLERTVKAHPQLRVVGIHDPVQKALHPPLPGVELWLEAPLYPGTLVSAVNDLLATLSMDVFREDLLRRQSAPLSVPRSYQHWGLNE